MSSKSPVRYVERFIITHNRGPLRVSREMEIVVDLATVRRVMGVRAAMSKGQTCKAGPIVVRAIGDITPIGDATSHRLEVSNG